MIRLFLEGCRVLCALTLIAVTLSAIIAIASLITRAQRRKTQPNTRKP